MDLLSHQRMLTAVATRLVGRAEADDIVQETFLRALVHPPADTDAPAAPWLATVARNLAVDLLRHRGRLVELSDEGEEGGPAPVDAGLPTLLSGLGALSPGEVTVLLLRDALDLDVDEVSVALDTSPESVRVLHHRARRKAAVPAALHLSLVALDRFLTWLLARSVAGLPVVGRPADPGITPGVLVAHLSLLDAVIELARARRDVGVEGRARLSRGIARLALGRADAAEDLRAAVALGADRTLAEARLAPLLYSRGETAAALDAAVAALGRGDHPSHHGILHRVAAQVYLARGDTAAAEPHLAALRTLSDQDTASAAAAVARARLAMEAERYAEAHAELVGALDRVRAGGNLRNEAVTLNNLAYAAMCLAAYGEATEWLDQGLALSRRLGDARTEALLLGNLATLQHLEGRLDDAAATFAEAIAGCVAQDMVLATDVLRTRAAALAQQAGRVDAAVVALDAVVQRLGDLSGLSFLPRVQRFGALAELGRADPSVGRALADEAAALPSVARAVALYQALATGDLPSIDRALAAPEGTGPVERIARFIVARATATRRRQNSSPGR